MKVRLSAYVRKALDQSVGAANVPSPKDGRPGSPGYGLNDIASLVRTILDHWDSVFQSRLPRMVRNYLHELRNIRDRWAHEEPFSAEEAKRALDTIHQVALAIGAGNIPSAQEGPAPTSTVRRLLERCLQKDVKLRLRDIGDARIEIDSSWQPDGRPEPARARVRSGLLWLPCFGCPGLH